MPRPVPTPITRRGSVIEALPGWIVRISDGRRRSIPFAVAARSFTTVTFGIEKRRAIASRRRSRRGASSSPCSPAARRDADRRSRELLHRDAGLRAFVEESPEDCGKIFRSPVE